ncbi:MAG: tRNA pseudouridine(38-40) synthase TruA [Anaerolineae bacterium]|nr:tRNA pseudouridine(38-40) synthase TruA [Anaerolineae bacterium]
MNREWYLRALVEYDGTDFFGFQRQATHRTVQGELEDALEAVTQERASVIGAGRTDTGVHAIGQVVAFRTRWRHDIATLERAWNALLPEDVAVRDVVPAPEGFHPRFSARSRWYRYTVWDGRPRSPLRRRYAWVYPVRLDEGRMNEAAKFLVGRHDFKAFGQPPQGENTVRHISHAMWTRQGDTLWFDIRGDAFLRRMVRNLVGTLLRVGRGERPPEWVAEVLAGGDRSQSAPPAPACGLCLMEVSY